MKQSLCFFLFFAVATTAFAYEVKSAPKANFAQQQAASQEQNAAQSTGTGYRSFSSANPGWSRRVQTSPVQTQVAGSQVTNFQPASTEVKADKIATKVGTTNPANTSNTPKPAPTQASTQTATENAAVNPQEAAAVQQLQGMQDMMKNMGALMGGANASGGNNKPGNGSQSGASGQQQQGGQANNGNAAMPAGMPNFSAILNSAGMGNMGNQGK